jgi:hypothetical protein
VLDEVQGATHHCPVTRAVRAHVHHLQTGRITQCKAKVRRACPDEPAAPPRGRLL